MMFRPQGFLCNTRRDIFQWGGLPQPPLIHVGRQPLIPLVQQPLIQASFTHTKRKKRELSHLYIPGGTPAPRITLKPSEINWVLPKFEPLKIDVHTFDGVKVDEMELPREIFGVPIRPDILQRTVKWQLAKRRKGLAKAKDRKEVRGSGRKHHQQKKTGRARAGSRRAPNWRGGGVSHGPRRRSFAFKLPKKVLRLGLRVALSAKYTANKLRVVQDTELVSHKTKNLRGIFTKNGWKSALIVVGREPNWNLQRASGNISKHFEILPALGLNCYSILRREMLVLSKQSFEYIIHLLKP